MSNPYVTSQDLNRVLIADKDLHELLEQYLIILESNGYFSDIDPSSQEYRVLTEKARDVFLENVAEQYKEEGNAFMIQKRHKVAIELYEAAINIKPTEIYYSNLAAALFNVKEFEQSASASRTAFKLNPNYSKAYVRFGRAMASLGDFETAEKNFDKALELEPGMNLALEGKKDLEKKKKLRSSQSK